MQDLLKRLRAERDRIVRENSALFERAEKVGTDGLTRAEQILLDSVTAEAVEIDDRIEQLQRQGNVDRGAVEPFIRPAHDRRAGVRHRSTGDEELDEFVFGSQKVLEVSFESVKRSVSERTGAWEVRDLLGGSGTGANTVPTSFRSQLYEHLIETSAIRKTNATILTTESGERMLLPKTTAHTTGTIVAEAGTILESDPTFGQGTLDAYKYGRLVQLSTELLSDNGLSGNDLLAYLARSFGRALGNTSGAHFITGDGSSKPRGVIAAAGTIVQVQGGTGVGGVPTADNLIDLFYELDEPYRTRSFWLMSTAAAKSVRKLKDADNNYIWAPGLHEAPDTLLGRPVVVDPYVPACGTSATSIAFGDFSAYMIRDAGPARFERSDDFAFDTDLVTFRALIRTDGDLLDETGAIGSFKGGTA